MDGVKAVKITRNETNVQPLKNQVQGQGINPAGNFGKVFESALHRQETVHFSKHANMRLNARQINLTGEQLSRVEEGLSKAHDKGIRDSLVLVDDVALVVNVKSKTVITAMDYRNQTQENVYSNIDGAVIV